MGEGGVLRYTGVNYASPIDRMNAGPSSSDARYGPVGRKWIVTKINPYEKCSTVVNQHGETCGYHNERQGDSAMKGKRFCPLCNHQGRGDGATIIAGPVYMKLREAEKADERACPNAGQPIPEGQGCGKCSGSHSYSGGNHIDMTLREFTTQADDLTMSKFARDTTRRLAQRLARLTGVNDL